MQSSRIVKEKRRRWTYTSWQPPTITHCICHYGHNFASRASTITVCVRWLVSTSNKMLACYAFFVVLWKQFLIYRVLPQAFSSGKCGERICNAQDCNGETPLHIAARRGCLPVVNFFFSNWGGTKYQEQEKYVSNTLSCWKWTCTVSTK